MTIRAGRSACRWLGSVPPGPAGAPRAAPQDAGSCEGPATPRECSSGSHARLLSDTSRCPCHVSFSTSAAWERAVSQSRRQWHQSGTYAVSVLGELSLSLCFASAEMQVSCCCFPAASHQRPSRGAPQSRSLSHGGAATRRPRRPRRRSSGLFSDARRSAVGQTEQTCFRGQKRHADPPPLSWKRPSRHRAASCGGSRGG